MAWSARVKACLSEEDTQASRHRTKTGNAMDNTRVAAFITDWALAFDDSGPPGPAVQQESEGRH